MKASDEQESLINSAADYNRDFEGFLDAELGDDIDLDSAIPDPAEEHYAAQENSAQSASSASPESQEVDWSHLDTTRLDEGLESLTETYPLHDDADESATKLDLARAYVEMGDREGALDLLDEVVRNGNELQQAEAHELIQKMSEQ